MDINDLVKWIGKVGWVAPTHKTLTAQIAVKIIGVKFGYGRWMLEVEPIAGAGSWLVAIERVHIDREEGL